MLNASLQTAPQPSTQLSYAGYGRTALNVVAAVSSFMLMKSTGIFWPLGAEATETVISENSQHYLERRDALEVQATPPMGEVNFFSPQNGIAVSANIACVTLDVDTIFRTVDVSDPVNPAIIGFLDGGGGGLGDVAITGSYAYMLDFERGLQIIDVSNPASPFIASWAGRPQPQSVTIADNMLYLGNNLRLYIFDISNPINPVEIGTYTFGWVNDVAIAGDTAYVVAQNSGLHIINVTNAANPLEMGVYDTTGSATGVAVKSDYVYVADGSSGLRIIDVSDLSNPVEVGFYDTPASANNVFVEGNYAYVADSAGLYIIDVSAPFQPALVSTFSGATRDVILSNSIIYLSQGNYLRTLSPAPLLFDNQPLNVIEGGTVLLNSVNFQVSGGSTTDGQFRFNVYNVTHGYFEEVTNPGVAITYFIQQQILNETIQFTHDGSENAHSYTIMINGDWLSYGPYLANITFTFVNDTPQIITNKSFILFKGETITMTPEILNTADPDNSNLELTFNIANSGAGYFRNATIDTAITQFSMQQILDNDIRFVSDGSGLPSYNIDVDDGLATSNTEAASIIYIAQNQLVTKPGDTFVLSSKQLAIQTQLAPTAVEILLSNIQYGRFEKSVNPGVSIPLFTLTELNAGAIQFAHSGTEDIPQYTMHFRDVAANYTSTRGIAGYTILNHAPFVLNPIGSLNWPINTFSNYTIPGITFSDSDGDPLQLSVVELNDAPLPAWIQFDNATNTLTGTPTASGLYDFKIIATDPYDESDNDRFSINVRSAGNTPSLTANALTVLEGQTVILTSADLAADDPDDDNNTLLFTVSNVQNSQFERVSNPGVSITTFTQLEVINAGIQFVHDGNENAPYYEVSVSDTTTASTNDAAAITFINVNDAPVLNNYNILITSPGQSLTLDGNYLSATDVDSDDNTLTFTISNMQNCRFELITSPGTPLTSFTQQQLQNGNIQFVHTQVASLPKFQVSVSDGSLSITPVDAMVFQIVNNQLVVEPGKTVLIILDNINVLTQQPATDTMIIITNVANGYFTQISNPGQSINSFSLQQIKDGEIAFVKDNKDIVPTYEIRLSYTDATQLTPPATPDIRLNHPPVVATKIQDQQASKAKPFDFTLSENTFSDPDGDPLTVSLEMQDGSTKPAWLQFQPNYGTNRHRFFGRPATPGGVPIRVIARDPYNASANADFLLQVMGNITNIVNEGANPVPFIAAIIGGTALLATSVAIGIGCFIKAKDKKTRQQHEFARKIRHHLGLQKADNFKSQKGQQFIQAVQSLSALLQTEQGIDIANMDDNRLDELASNIAASAKNKITPDTAGLFKKSKITIQEFADNISEIARDNRLDDISYVEVDGDDVSIPMQMM